MSLDLGTLSARVEVDTNSFKSSIAGVKRDLTAVKKNMEAVSGQKMDVAPTGGDKLDKADASAKTLKQSLSNVSSTKADVSPKGADGLDKADSSAKKLKDSLDGAESAAPDVTPKGADGLDRASQSSERLKDSLDKASQAGQTTRFPTQPGEEIDRTTEKAGRLSGVFGSMKGAIGFAGMTAAAGGVAFSFRSILEAGNELQNNMNILGAVSGASEQQLRAAGDAARELGTAADLPATSAGSAAAAMAELAKGGFSVEESMTAARGTLQLAAAAGIEAADAATIQSQAIQSFGLEAADAARVSDILAGAANASSAEIGGIAQGLAQSGSVAKQFGLSIEDTSTALAMFANAGIQGSDAGTMLKSALLAVTDQGAPAQGAIEELGLSVYDMQGNFVGLPSLFGQLADAQKRMTPEAYQAATATLFGSDAMRLAGIAAEQGSEGFETLKGQVTEAGQAAKLAEDMTKGLPGAIGKIGNELEATGQKIYDKFAGPLEDSLLTATDRIGQFNEAILPDVMDGAAAVAGNFAGQISIIAGAAADTAGALSGILTPAIDGAKGAMDKAGIGDAIQSLGTPVVTGALVMLASNLTHLTDKVEAGAGKVKSFAGATKTSMGEIAQSFGTAYTSGSSHMRGLSDSYRLAAETARTQAMATSNSWDYADRSTAQMARGFQANITQMGGVATGFTTGTLGAMKTGFGQLSGAAGGLVSALGGPWGIAIGVASTAVGILAQRHQEAKAAEEEHKAAQDELRGSLDTTTGAITAQTRELVAKKLEESGSAETARELGLSQGVVADAAMGNADAQRKVQQAVTDAKNAAVTGTDAWQKHAKTFEQAGLSAADVQGALNGNAEAMERISNVIFDENTSMGFSVTGDAMDALGLEIDKTAGKYDNLADTVNATSGDLEKLQADQAADALANMGRAAEQSSALLAAVGDSIVAIPDEKTIIVSSMAPAVRDEMRELGMEITDLPDGTVQVKFPEGMNITQVLRDMGAEIKMLPDGRINISDNTPEVQQKLIDLGLAVRDEKTGEVTMKDNISEVIGKQVELKAAVVDPVTGEVYVNDNVGYVLAGLQGLGIAAQTIPPGSVYITDNTPQNQANLANLGIATTLLPDGSIAITDTSPQNLANLAALGTTTQTLPPGYVHITDTSPENMARLDSLGIKTTTLPNGQVVISDNADSTANHIRTVLAPGAVSTFSDHVVNITRRVTDIFTGGDKNADGNVYNSVRAFADGGVERAMHRRQGGGTEPQHTAHIAPAGTYRVFAESETGGEAYIPLGTSKRGRSTSILADVAERFGYRLLDQDGQVQTFAEGGVIGSLKNVVQSQFPMLQATSTFRAGDPGHHGRGEAVDFSNGYDTTPEMQAATRMLYTRYKNQLAELIHYPLNGWKNVEEGNDFDFGAATNSEHRNHVHVAARQPLSSPVPMTNEGLDDYDSLDGPVGSRAISGYNSARTTSGDGSMAEALGITSKSSTKKSRKLNGGAGTLIKDGSVMELAAALYSKRTGAPMQDDIVSWGQVMGLYSEAEEEDDENKDGLSTKKASTKLAADQKKVDKLKADLPEAEEKLRIQKIRRDEVYNKTNKDGEKTATESQKADADLQVEKAERKVAEINQEISELEAGLRELEAHIEKGPGYHPDSDTSGTSGNKYADAIIREGKRRGITDRGIQIALATALVESEMKMYANESDPESMSFPHDAVGSDHDSVGLFQQRNNGAWGTTADRMDPEKSAGMFYDKLDDQDYNQGDPGAHAQRVQVSAFPGKYALRMDEAMKILQTYEGSAGNGVKVTPMANGGILGNARGAQINEGSAVLWAEAGPEAYIPLSSNKRAESTKIWAETGKRLGIDVMSMLNLIGSGLPGLMQGQVNVNTGGSVSLSALGLNMDAASYRGGRAISDNPATQNAVGAVFNGPVQINDPRKYLQGQYDNAAKQLGNALRSVML